jgi:3-oxoadipate enol-lactonase
MSNYSRAARAQSSHPPPCGPLCPGPVIDVQENDLTAGPRTASSAITRDGTRLVYELQPGTNGDSGLSVDGIALVHSLAMDRFFWQPVVKRLAKAAPVLVYDCRGHGESDKPAGPYTVELFARDLADLLDHVGWNSALVAGASMGGCVTLAFAAACPARAAALGLIDTTAWYGAEAPRQWAERSSRALTDGMSALVEFQSTRWFSDAFRVQHPEIVKRCVEVFLRNEVPAYVETCKMLGAADLRAALPAITMPAAVVVGEEDYATPVAMAEALQRGIKGATLTVLAGARHLTPLEAPARIADELSALMKRIKTRNATR